MKSIAIIGAGLSGLTAASFLNAHAAVTVFDKSRGVSGRLSTRRADPYQFDHGAPFFKVRSPEFKQFLAPLIEAGVVSQWQTNVAEISGVNIVSQCQYAKNSPYYLGVPSMNAMAKFLAKRLNISLGVRVERIEKIADQWQLYDDHGNDLGCFDWVISAIPAQQCVEVIPKSLALYKSVSSVNMQGCYALMLGFEKALSMDFDTSLITDSDLSCITVNHQKPSRNSAFGLTVLSSNTWAEKHIEEDQETVKSHLVELTSRTIGQDVSHASHIALHRWRYANITAQANLGYLLAEREQISVCGDWLLKGQVESAFLSGYHLSNRLLKALN